MLAIPAIAFTVITGVRAEANRRCVRILFNEGQRHAATGIAESVCPIDVAAGGRPDVDPIYGITADRGDSRSGSAAALGSKRTVATQDRGYTICCGLLLSRSGFGVTALPGLRCRVIPLSFDGYRGADRH